MKYFGSAYKFGSLGGLFSLISFLFLSWLYGDPTNLNLVFGYIIVPVVIFLSVKFFKEYSNGGMLSFSEGMSVGFVAYMILGVISGLGIWIALLISDDLFQSILIEKIQILTESRDMIISQVGENSFNKTKESIQDMTKFDVALNDTLWKIIPGLFFTIIISIILRKTQ